MKKNQYRILTGSLVLLGTVLPTQSTHAANLYWDGTDTTADADGGAGNWDTTAQNWDTAATAGANAAFTATDTAIFGGTGGNVSLAAAITAAGINVNANGYTIGGNNLTLGAGGSINVAPGITTTVGTTFPSGLTKTGTGTLVMSGGANSYTGATVISAGTLQVGDVSPNAFRYYRFHVVQKFNTGDTYNQFSELAYFKTGAKVVPVTGASSTGVTSGTPANEGFWGNANDNLGQTGAHTKFGTAAMPYWLSYDFGTPKNFDGYNWATANDSPGRNPARWQVLASTDNVNWTIVDDQSRAVRTGPTALYTWSAASGVLADFALVVNANPAVGASKAYPINYASRTSLPTGTPVQIAAGATFDLNSHNQRVASLADSGGGGGSVTTSTAFGEITLEVGGTDHTNFSGVISDQGEGATISFIRAGSGTQTLSGSQSNTYGGLTVVGDTGRLILAKTGGATAVPGHVSIATNAFGANSTGLVLGGNEQIVNTAEVTFPGNSYGGGVASNSYFRLNGYTETIAGLISPGTIPVVENRGSGDATAWPAGRLIINTPTGKTYTYAGQFRNVDGTQNTAVNLGITKTGPGTQILTGNGANATGAGEVNAGLLRLNGSYGGTMLVTGTGTMEGTGNNTGLITVNSGGILSSGAAGAGTLTSAGGASIGSGGTLTVGAGTTLAAATTIATGGTATVGGTISNTVTVAGALSSTGTLGSTVTVANGGTLNATGTVSNTLSVQNGGALTVGNAIATLTTSATVNLAGTINMQVDKTSGVITNDKLSGFSGITYGGTLNLTFTGDTPVLGEPIQLFVPPGGGASFTGSFTTVSGLPLLPAGNQWDLSGLLTNGTIVVTNTASKPAFSPSAGDFQGTVSLTITGDSGSTIYYTMDGSEPTLASPNGASPLTGITIPANSDVTVKAFATLSGFTDSAVVTNIYHTIDQPKWNVDANGNWTDTANWERNVTANGIGVSADFTKDQTAARTVTVNASRTVGKLMFGNANSFAWLLNNSNSSTLTLATSTGSPEIAVAEVGTGVDVDVSISSPLSGTQGFTKTGAGTLGLTGAKNYTGTLAINGGRVTTDALATNGANSPLGAGTSISMDGGILRYTGTGNVPLNTFNRTIALGAGGGTVDTGTPANFWFLSGVISGPGNFTKVGARQMIIQAINTYDGQTFINEGEVQIRTAEALGSAVGNTVVANGARLAIGGGFGTATVTENLNLTGMGITNSGAYITNDAGVIPTFSGSVTINGDTGFGGTANLPIVPTTFTGAIGGTGNLVKVGVSTMITAGSTSNTYVGLTKLGGNGKLRLAKTGGATAITGDIQIGVTGWNGNDGGLVLGGSDQIVDTSVITWIATNIPDNGAAQEGFFRLNGNSETIGGLNILAGGNGTIENRGYLDNGTYGNPTLTLNVTGANSFAFPGGIRDIDQGDVATGGKINITKTGTGTQSLGGGAQLSYAGNTTVNEGTLILIGSNNKNSPITVNTGGTLKGTHTTPGTLTVNSGGTLAPGLSAGTLSVGATVIDGTYACEVDGATADRLTVTGNLDVAGAVLNFDVLNAPTSLSYIIASYTGTLTGVLEVIDLPANYSVVYDADQKQIRLQRAFAGYADFAAVNNLTGDANSDFDNDGLANGVEYVLGTAPRSSSSASAPTVETTGGNMTFTFHRSDASLTPDTAVAIEVSTTLQPGSWTSYTVGVDTAGSTAPVTVSDNGATDTVSLSLPQVPDAAKFARLKVTVTPP